MIITESDRDSKSSPPSDATSVAGSSSLPAPPAYQTVPAPSPPAAPAASPQMPISRPSLELKAREPAWRRFLKAFCFAAVIYILLGMLLKSFVDMTDIHIVKGEPAGPWDSDGRVIQCANDTLRLEVDQQQQYPSVFPPYSSTMTFSVPVSTSLIFLLSRGSYDQGSSVKFEISDKSGNDIEIDVVMSYYSNDVRRRTRVCLLERDEGGKGVGFFTPRRFYPDESIPPNQIIFATNVRFPKSGSHEHPLVINALETNMGSWTQRVASLEGRVVFRSISLQGSNSPIRSDSVSAESAKFKTSNSPITGSYNVTDSLILATSNSPITADIRLENHDGHKPTLLDVKTSNGRIQIPVTLVSTGNSACAPAAYTVSAKTSNSGLAVSFPEAPTSPFPHLEFTGKTSNSPVNIKLHSTYEGSISLKTSSIFSPGLVQNAGTQDPSGQGRHRTVEVRKRVKGALEGGVWWGTDSNKDEGKGKVVVTTSNGNPVVELA